jgi:hypothetical protein
VAGAQTTAGSLARTGTDPRPLAFLGVLLIGAGIAFTGATRLRQLAWVSRWTSSGGRSRMISAIFGRKSR